MSVIKRTLGTLENGLTTVTNKVENIPGKITLEVNTAKEELKKFTISQIEISEDRISSSVTSNVNGIISSSVNQSSGMIRQAITSANDATKSYAQSIVQQEANARQTSLTQINNKLTDYNVVKERVDLFSRTLGRTEGDLSTNIANMLMTNDSFQTMISNVDVRRQNLIKDTDTFKTMKPVDRNNISLTVLNTAGIQLASNSKNNSWGGFTLPLTINSLHPNKKYTISFEIVIWEFYPGETSIGVQLKNHNDNKGVTFYHVPSSETPNKQSRIRVKKTIDQKSYFSLYQGNIDLYPFYVWLNGRGRFAIYDIMLVEGDQISSVYSPNNSDAITSLVRQTSTQYAVNILSGSRELITEINASPDGVRIKGKNIELDGQALIHNAVIKNSMIADAAINKAKIANASIIDGHIVNLNANKLVGLEGEFRKITAVNGIFNNVFTAGLDIGNTRMTFSNGSLDILRKGGVTTDVTIRSNGRYSGPTQFNGRVTNSTDYVPVMTNLYQDYPLRPSRRRDVAIYGIRGMFLITFSGQTNEYGSSGWLYVNDGSGQNHTWYVPMKRAQTQVSWHGGFDS